MIVFINIETVPLYQNLSEYDKELQDLWLHKSKFLKQTEEEKENIQLGFKNNASFFAEWSKVICIGLGYINKADDKLHLKSISGKNEKDLLNNFVTTIKSFTQKVTIRFCGHNIKEFDIPFLCRRLLVNEIAIPQPLDVSGLKPWENNHIDTMQLWKFGNYNHFTSLALLSKTLGVPNSKSELDGSMVTATYYEEKNLEKIVAHCLNDVETTAKVYYRLKGQELPFKSNYIIK